MKRRQVLALLGSAAVGGCVGGESGGRTTTTVQDAVATTTETTTAPDETETRTTTPEPPDVGEHLPSECPIFGDHVERVVCHPGADAPLSMTPFADSVSLPNASLSFTLANETDATFEVNFYGWRLHKRIEGRWHYIAPGMWPEPLHRLPPGESHEWDVTVNNTDLGAEIRDPSSTKSLPTSRPRRRHLRLRHQRHVRGTALHEPNCRRRALHDRRRPHLALADRLGRARRA